jgi:hypothetical protein
MKTRWAPRFLLLIAFAVVPAALEAQATKAVDRIGTYDIEFDMNGQPQTGVLHVNLQDGRLTGSLEVHGHVIPLEPVSLKERVLTATGAQSAEISFTFTFKTNDRFEGTYDLHGNVGPLTGVRRTK